MPSEFYRFLSPPYCFHFWIHSNRNREVTGWSFRMLFAPNHRLHCYETCCKDYFYDVITLFKSLRFKNFDIQRFSSSSFVYCSYFKLAMSNIVFVSKQFRTTNILSRSLPVFLSEKQSKSKLFNHLFLFYFLSISTFWKPIPSKGLKFLENKEVHHLH